MSIKLEIRRTFSASQEKVFQAFTEPNIIKQWFGPGPMTNQQAELEQKVGGLYTFAATNPEGEVYTVKGTIKEYKPYEKLAYTWKWTSPGAIETMVTFTFIDKGSETEVYLLHENFETEESKSHHNAGWDGCFDKLNNFFAE